MVRRIPEARQNTCYMDVFKVILEHKIEHAQHRRGMFFNLTHLPDDVVRLIDDGRPCGWSSLSGLWYS